MITEADHQGGWVVYPTALPAFIEVNHNLHVATKLTGIHVQESENKLLLLLLKEKRAQTVVKYKKSQHDIVSYKWQAFTICRGRSRISQRVPILKGDTKLLFSQIFPTIA